MRRYTVNGKEAELRACALDIGWRYWSGAKTVWNKTERRNINVLVYKFYNKTGLVYEARSIDVALKKIRKLCEDAFNARHQKKLLPETEKTHYWYDDKD